MIYSNIFSLSKKEYIKGERPDVDCIICAIRDKDEAVSDLTVYETKHTFVTLNLFPYNSGHLMIIPKRHVKDPRELTKEENIDFIETQNKAITVIEKLYSPSGINLGFNLGENAGASIDHIHQHLIPRYPNELGVIDLIGGAKVLVEDPRESLEKIREAFKSN